MIFKDMVGNMVGNKLYQKWSILINYLYITEIYVFYLVAWEGFEPLTFGYEPDELPDCSTPRFLYPTEIAGYSPYLGINP